jgi:hypothetical protein
MLDPDLESMKPDPKIPYIFIQILILKDKLESNPGTLSG